MKYIFFMVEKMGEIMSSDDKYRKNMRCLDKWLSNNENGKSIADYLKAHQIYRVGIYGYGMLGKHLTRELRLQNYPVSWVMDKFASGDDICRSLLKPIDLALAEEVDMVIITPLTDVEEVEVILRRNVTGRIISMDELIDSIYVWGNQN